MSRTPHHRQASTGEPVGDPSAAGTGAGRDDRVELRLAVSAIALRRTGRAAAALVGLLAAGHALTLVLPDRLGAGEQWGPASFLDLANEQSLGTWFTSVLHLSCALLALGGALLARRDGSRWARNWVLLAVAFLAMSIDEVAALHDRVMAPLQYALGTSGLLLYAWIIPAAIAGVVFLVLQLGFLRHLGRVTGLRLLLAGGVFVAGALGLEMVEGVLATGGASESTAYTLLVLVEETLEVAAVLWVAVILVGHLRRWTTSPGTAPEALPADAPAAGPTRRAHRHTAGRGAPALARSASAHG